MTPELKLYAPEGYWRLSAAERAGICNGCGPKAAAFLVPETLWGLSVTAACDIHDWMYHVGRTLEDKQRADRVFLNNMLRIIDARTRCRLLKRLRRDRAWLYYAAVRDFGGPWYWHGKNPTNEERSV